MVDVLGCFLGLPHGTTPAAVKTNKIKRMSSFKSSKIFKRKRLGQTYLFWIINLLCDPEQTGNKIVNFPFMDGSFPVDPHIECTIHNL